VKRWSLCFGKRKFLFKKIKKLQERNAWFAPGFGPDHMEKNQYAVEV